MKASQVFFLIKVRSVVTLTFGSLFAGIGGFDLGFERAGMVCKWQVEIDDYANRVLAKHWPEVHRERDIRECGQHNLEAVDVICGGFPCQDISYAGLGAGLDGERSGLFFEAIRVVRELRPKVVVLENVAALLTRGLDRVLGTLAEIGFDAEWHCIPAAAVGAPHIRDRVFVLAYTKSIGAQRRNERQNTSDGTGRDSGIKFGKSSTTSRILADTNKQGMERRQEAGDIESGRTHPRQLIMRLSKPRKRSDWAVEPDVGRVAHGVSARVDRLRGLGNAVVPQVAEFIGRRIVQLIIKQGGVQS
jgi:DNA (cytosine-5)-methyltransferase 1